MFGSLHVTIFRPLIVHQALTQMQISGRHHLSLMLSIKRNKTKIDIVAAVQKSGFAWALDRNNGNLIWSTVSCTASSFVSDQIHHLFFFLRKVHLTTKILYVSCLS